MDEKLEVQTASAVKTDKPKTRKKPPRYVGQKIAPGLKLSFLGGVGEVGKNMIAIEYGNDMIVIEIDDDEWEGIIVTPDNIIEIYGEIDKNLMSTPEVDVERIVVIQ
jgi:hypothetical protein